MVASMVGVDGELEVPVTVAQTEAPLLFFWTVCRIPVVFVLVSCSRIRDSLLSILLTNSLAARVYVTQS